jgi:TrmH family RNA methyltransferase
VPQQPLKWYRELGTNKGRLQAGAFAVEGERAVRQIIASLPDAVTEILTTDDTLPEFQSYPVRTVTESQFNYVSHTRTPQGVMAIVRLPEESYSATLPEDTGDKILLLEDIQDPGNVGTLIRTAAALGFSGVIMTESSADPFAPKCVQATAGAVLSVWLRRTAKYLDVVQKLRQNGYLLVAAELNGQEDTSVLRSRKLILALGNEGAGLSPELLTAADCRLRLPTAREKAESLNVAACGAILMYLASQNRQRQGTS